jgi:hypothetical protein
VKLPTVRGYVALGAAIGLTATTLIAASAAQATAGTPAGPATPSPDPQVKQAAVAHSLAGKLGGRSAGSYIDNGRLVVTVTDASAAKAVTAAGAQAKLVTRSGSDLKKVQKALKREVTTPGTAYAVDPRTNKVVLSYDASVTGARLAKVKAAAKRHGASVSTKRVAGRFRTFTIGGEAIYSGGGRCSLGFNAKKGSDYYFITAGHCAELAGKDWYADQGQSTKLGTVTTDKFPGEDYAVVKYDAAPADTQGAVKDTGGAVDITGAAEATVGQTVKRSGSTTGVHDGQVTALDQTVNYSEGQVDGLIQTTVCAEPGDSGGSLFAGDKALGVTSGGSGDCTNGGETFFNPVSDAIQASGVEIY